MFFSSSFYKTFFAATKKRSGIIYLHRSAVYISLSDSLSCVFSCFNQLCKCCGVCDGDGLARWSGRVRPVSVLASFERVVGHLAFHDTWVRA